MSACDDWEQEKRIEIAEGEGIYSDVMREGGSMVWVWVWVCKTQRGGRYCKMGQREGEKSQRTKLPASPPAINATPINKITLALQAAGPSDPHASPENAEWRWVLSSRETIRNPTGC